MQAALYCICWIVLGWKVNLGLGTKTGGGGGGGHAKVRTIGYADKKIGQFLSFWSYFDINGIPPAM